MFERSYPMNSGVVKYEGDTGLYEIVNLVGPGHKDKRRIIDDLLDEGEVAQHANCIRFNFIPGRKHVGGNHYHPVWEKFFLSEGHIALLVVEDMKTKKRGRFYNIPAGAHIKLPPNVSHAFVVDEECVLVGFMPVRHSPDLEIAYRLVDGQTGEEVAREDAILDETAPLLATLG